MKILDYVKGLKNSFTMSRAKDELSATSDELVNQTIPVVSSANTMFIRIPKMQSKFYESVRQSVSHVVKGNEPVTASILRACENSLKVLGEISVHYEKDFGDELTAEALSLRQANMIQMVDHIAAFSRYSRGLIDTILMAEGVAKQDASLDELGDATTAYIKYLSNGRPAFIATLEMMQAKPETIMASMDKAPEIILSEVRSESALNVHGRDVVDPLKFNMFQADWNPIWRIGNNWANRYNERYQTAKTEVKTCELRLEHYKRLHENNPSPQMEMVIKKRMEELDLRRAKLAKLEKF